MADEQEPGAEREIAEMTAFAERVAAAQAKLKELAQEGRTREGAGWQSRLQEVLEELQRLAEERPANAKLLVLRARSLLGVRGQGTEQRGREACDLARKAVTLRPDRAWAWASLGEVLARVQGPAGREESLAAIDKAVEIEPNCVQAHLALVRGRLMRLVESKEAPEGELGLAVSRAIETAERVVAEQGDEELAATARAELAYTKARLLHRQLRFEACVEACENVLHHQPGHELAGYLRVGALAAIAAADGKAAGVEGIARAPPKYVAQLFDSYAHKFDDHLVNGLHYRTPELIREELLGRCYRRVADLGCGTGLGVERLHKVGCCATPSQGDDVRIAGVDLSAKMVDQARALGLYTDLHVADVDSWMRAQPDATFDLVLSSDVFVYLGDLAPTVQEAARVLAPGGTLAFSVETCKGLEQGFVLQPTRRFAHSASYVAGLCEANGLRRRALREGAELRRQNGQPLCGTIVVFEKPLA